MEYKAVKIEIYIPIRFINQLRVELNHAGACKVGNYDQCMSVTQVSGYWRPLTGAEPYDGKVGEVSHSQEVKVEVRCEKEYVKAAIDVIKKVHPYEEPLFNIIPLLN